MTVTVSNGVSATFLGFAGWVGANAPPQAQKGDLWRDDSTDPPTFRKCTSTTPLTFVSIEGGGGGSQVGIQFRDEGVNQGTTGTVSVVNFTGGGVTASRAADTLTVDIPASSVPNNTKIEEIVVTVDGGGSTITTGDTGSYYSAPYAATITGWYLTGSPSGSIVIDVWKAAGAIPTNTNSIAGTEKPTLSSQQLASDTTLTSWTTSVAVGDVFGFEVESATTVTKVTLVLSLLRT